MSVCVCVGGGAVGWEAKQLIKLTIYQTNWTNIPLHCHQAANDEVYALH